MQYDTCEYGHTCMYNDECKQQLKQGRRERPAVCIRKTIGTTRPVGEGAGGHHPHKTKQKCFFVCCLQLLAMLPVGADKRKQL